MSSRPVWSAVACGLWSSARPGFEPSVAYSVGAFAAVAHACCRVAEVAPHPSRRRRRLRAPDAVRVAQEHAHRGELGRERVGRRHVFAQLGGRECTVAACGAPRYTVRTARPRLVRVRRTYSSACPRGKLPCASGTYSTQEAGTRSPYVQYGGSGAYVSA